MTRTLDTFLQEEQQKREREDKLRQVITDDKTMLIQARTEYEGAVIADDDLKTNELFQKIEHLENKIKADEHKLKTLVSVTDRHLKESAIATVRTFKSEVIPRHKHKVDAAVQKIEKAKQAYIDALDVLDGLNEAYNAERSEYRPILHRYNLQQREVNNKDSLYNNIDDPGKIAPDKTQMVITTTDILKGVI